MRRVISEEGESSPSSHYCAGRTWRSWAPPGCTCPNCIHPGYGTWNCTCANCSPHGWGASCGLDHCQLCGRSGRLAMQKHHVDYAADILTKVCARCHRRIHLGRLRPDLKPPVGWAEIITERRAVRAAGRAADRAAATQRQRELEKRQREIEKTAACPSCGFTGPTLYRTTCARCRRMYPWFVPSSSPSSPGTGGTPGMEIGT